MKKLSKIIILYSVLIFISINIIAFLSANVDAKDGVSALIEAATARNDQVNVVSDLLEKGVDIEAKENDGKAALLRASSRGLERTAKTLLDEGANINAKS